MSRSGSIGSLASGGSGERQAANQVRIMHNAPLPEQWTLVREVNMERREPCEVYISIKLCCPSSDCVIRLAKWFNLDLEIWSESPTFQDEGTVGMLIASHSQKFCAMQQTPHPSEQH